MLKLVINTHFDAAHHLPNYVGACHNLHGHRWGVRVIMYGEINPDTGMVMDFKVVKEIINTLDHKCLNKIVKNPTAENLVNYLKEQIDQRRPKSVKRTSVILWESPDCSVEV